MGTGTLESKVRRDEEQLAFADGNGRTGRIILFKECLKNNLIAVIIQDQNKDDYFAGLQEKGTEILERYFQKEQENYVSASIHSVLGNEKQKVRRSSTGVRSILTISLYERLKKFEPEMIVGDTGYKIPAIAKLLLDDDVEPLLPYAFSKKKTMYMTKSMIGIFAQMTAPFIITLRTRTEIERIKAALKIVRIANI